MQKSGRKPRTAYENAPRVAAKAASRCCDRWTALGHLELLAADFDSYQREIAERELEYLRPEWAPTGPPRSEESINDLAAGTYSRVFSRGWLYANRYLARQNLPPVDLDRVHLQILLLQVGRIQPSGSTEPAETITQDVDVDPVGQCLHE